MRHISITAAERQRMLEAVGVQQIEALFDDVPASARLERPLDLGRGMSEMELVRHVTRLAARNTPASSLVSFAGAGCYDHYVPAVVDHVIRRPEFFTAYTPYQPEASQGTLQAIYEYQTMICELTGADVANASMYDGATALVEAALMACRVTGRDRVLVCGPLHPEWVEVLATYAESGRMRIEVVCPEGPVCDPQRLATALGDDVAAVLLASPNFYGHLERVDAVAEAAHRAGALLAVATNPVLLAVLQPPAALGADIVVGEGQPLGGAMSFGGPGFGFFACRETHIRQMPGRLVGRTVDADGRIAYVLTLSTREQHIRREKATSNICSNHSLMALAAAVHLSALGRRGLEGVARACVAKAHYLRERLIATGRFEAFADEPFGYEFALRYHGDASEMHDEMLRRGYLAGVVLADEQGGDEVVLFAVTEKRTREEIDAFVEEVAGL